MNSFQTWLDWAGQHPEWLLLAGFALALVEALAVVGVLVPGILLLLMLGALVGWNPPLLAALCVALTLGAIAGDGASYALGRWQRQRLARIGWLRRNPHWLERGEQFFLRHGGRSVFIARFLGPLRPIVPLVAGSMGMPPRVFVPRMLVACMLWAPAMVIPGALFGESLALAAEFGGRLTLLLIVLAVGLWLLATLTRAIYEWGARRAQWWMKKLALWLRRHQRLGRWLGPLVEPGRREVQSVIILGLVLVLSLTGLIAALLVSPLSTSAWDAGFRFSGLAASLRSHFADPGILVIKLAGSLRVMIGVVVLVAAVLLILRRPVALLHWLLATLGGVLLALLLNGLVGMLLQRPAGSGSIAEVPNIEFTLAVLVLGFSAQMLARDLRPRRRKWLYLAVVVLLGLIGFSGFYFATATLNGLLTALALAAGWLALTGIGYRTRAGPLPRAGLLAALFALVWLGLTLVAVQQRHAEMSEQFQLERPERLMTRAQWRDQGWRELPRQRGRIGARERLRFDAQVAMPRERLVDALAAAGWVNPPRVWPKGLPAMFRGRPMPERLGHFGRDFAGKPQEIMMRRVLAPERVVLLRAWDSGARVGVEQVPVWLVQVRALEPVRRLGFFNTWRAEDTADAGLDALRRAGDSWRWLDAGPDGPWLIDQARPIPPEPQSPGSSSGSSSSRSASGSSASAPSGSESSSLLSSMLSTRRRSCGSDTASSSWACADSSGSTEASAMPSALASSLSTSCKSSKASCDASSRSTDCSTA